SGISPGAFCTRTSTRWPRCVARGRPDSPLPLWSARASVKPQAGDDLTELRWFEPDALPTPSELAFTHYPEVLSLALARRQDAWRAGLDAELDRRLQDLGLAIDGSLETSRSGRDDESLGHSLARIGARGVEMELAFVESLPLAQRGQLEDVGVVRDENEARVD